MAQHLKRWESPRREGRNDKGRGGSARQRQLRKQQQTLRRKLKETSEQPDGISKSQGRRSQFSSFFYSFIVEFRGSRQILLNIKDKSHA
jgi:hypothetical protein